MITVNIFALQKQIIIDSNNCYERENFYLSYLPKILEEIFK
jgi:hypothetical protein